MELNLEVKLKEWVDRTHLILLEETANRLEVLSVTVHYILAKILIYIYIFLDKGYIGWVVII